MERDISGKAVDRVAVKVKAVLENLQKKMPLGPSLAQITPSELRRSLDKMDRDKAIAYLSSLDQKALMQVLLGGSGNGEQRS